MTDTPKLNLRQKLIQVYSDIDHVEKVGRNQKQNYNFVRAADVLRVVRDSFAKLGIYAETNYELLGTYDIKTNSGGIMHTATVKATIKIHDADSDEFMIISGLGDGADSGDKGVYKAQTGSTKNALRNAFLLPDEADPEADEAVDNRIEPQEVLKRSRAWEEPHQDAQPDFQEARHEAPRPAAAPKAQKPAERPTAATAAEADGATNVVGNLVTASVSREPGDDSDTILPTEEELTDYRKKFSKLGDDLSEKGKLKSSKGLPINRKLLVFLLAITKADDAKNITTAQWNDFFVRVEKAKALETGLVGLAQLVNKTNGIEEKK
jgi:hypothetical protein